MEAVAGLFGDAAFGFDPAFAPAGYVGAFEVGAVQGFPVLEQLEDGFGQLRAGGPGLIDAGTGEHVGAAGTFADAGVAVADQDGLAAAAGFLKRLGAPGAETAAFKIAPQIGMQHEVLQVAVGGPHGTAEPGRHEDADGGHVAGVDVQEAEDFGLGIAKGMEDGARLEAGAVRQVHDHLHADGPLALMVSVGESEFGVELAADGSHGTIAHDGEGRADIHAGEVVGLGSAVGVHALVGETHAEDAFAGGIDEGFGDGHAGPDLDGAGAHQFAADELHELAEGENQAAGLMEEGRHVGQFDAVVAVQTEGAQGAIGEFEGGRAAAGADRIEQVDHPLLLHGRGHGDAADIQVGAWTHGCRALW